MDSVNPPAGMVLSSSCSRIADLLLGGGDFWSPSMQVIGQGRGVVVGEVTVGPALRGGEPSLEGGALVDWSQSKVRGLVPVAGVHTSLL